MAPVTTAAPSVPVGIHRLISLEPEMMQGTNEPGIDWPETLERWGAGPGQPFNAAMAALERHVDAGRGEHIAIRWLDREGGVHDYSFARLHALSERFAGALAACGVPPGERVLVLAGRVPAVHVAALGSLRHGAVFGALFSAFGPEPVFNRLRIAAARVLVTTPTLYRHKVAPVRHRLPELKEIWIVNAGELVEEAGIRDLDEVLGDAPSAPAPFTTEDHPALLHFTSGTTGEPKALVHVHQAAVVHAVTARQALGLHEGDIYWCTADPGWVTGVSYGMLAPLLVGATNIVDEGDFDAGRWLSVLTKERVSVWYTSPTAVRMLRRAGLTPTGGAPPALRHVASVGEPLDGAAVQWGEQTLGQPVHDTYWQTETGAIVIANLPATPVRPGAMGQALPGCTTAVVDPDEPARAVAPGAAGELALRGDWPSLFRHCLNRPDYRERVERRGWYLTGDLVRQDADGYFWFVGRSDDMIKTAGHMVGPFEVENALMAHPDVVEAGVVGAPDAVAGEVVWAFVTLRPGASADEPERRDIMAFARRRLGPAAAPRNIILRRRLPHTRSGKIMRRRLRALARRIQPAS